MCVYIIGVDRSECRALSEPNEFSRLPVEVDGARMPQRVGRNVLVNPAFAAYRFTIL
jgi:hypothetical protein